MSISVIEKIHEMQVKTEQWRNEKKKIALVPTMGYLHKGHVSLIEKARSIADIVITSIYVNPKQFSPNEDYNRYPRNFDHDYDIAIKAGTDFIFYPSNNEMYPNDFDSIVEVGNSGNILEGEFRPNHFRGVTTVVLKLFNITKPHYAIFGQKDAQQVFVINKMVRDLNCDVEIMIVPIVREQDGLALSSRNIYLNENERRNALVLYHSLQYAQGQVKQGERSIQSIQNEMVKILKTGLPTSIDYVAFIDPKSFSEIKQIQSKEILVLLAVRFGATRLIDNMLIQVPNN
jgi:pantoate--beta-alanine ligase